jgi:carboxymethylenebutenolidase
MSNSDLCLVSEAIALSDGFNMNVFVERPTKPAKATIVLLSPIFGVDAIFTRTMREWSAAGYLAVAPDYFARVLPGALPHTEDGFRDALRRVKAVNRDQLLADLRKIGSYFSKGGALFIGGYCAGGEPALRLALEGFGEGWVIFHAARLGLYADRLSAISGPLELHFGGADALVPPLEVERVSKGAVGNANIHLTVHPGADHGFTQEGGRNFHPEAAATAFALARARLDAALAR